LMQRMYDLVGRYITASENLIESTRPYFQGTENQVQRERFRSQHNEVDAEWRNQRHSIAYLLSYYHHGDLNISRAWDDVASAIAAYEKCATDWLLNHQTSTDNDIAKSRCPPLNQAVRDRVNHLNQLVQKFRQDEMATALK